ncbi:MAG: DedA family protein [Bacillota bacterium]
MVSWQSFVELFLHLDKHLALLIQSFGGWSYLVLFLIIFLETGLVITPFLPGDSLIFTAGAVAATGSLDAGALFLVLSLAAMSGDSSNYWIGFLMRAKVLRKKRLRFIKNEYLERTNRFYERHGGKTIVLARFIPIIRTFAPFVAGIGRMTYWRFVFYSVLGSLSWIAIFLFTGYLFGNIPAVQSHFSLVIFGIVAVSLTPAVFEFFQQYRQSQKQSQGGQDGPESGRK